MFFFAFLHRNFFYAFLCLTEIQDGHQKWRENNYLRNNASRYRYSTVDADTLRVKNFVEIVLSRSISEINPFLQFTQKFKMAAKVAEKQILRKVARRLW